jgi:ABC-type hemin transport system ATPase subunit
MTLPSARAMTAESQAQTNGGVLPGLAICLGKVASDSTASTFNRLEAVDLLLRLAIGPRNRPANSIDVAASRTARLALSDAAPFLDQTMTSNNRARIRLHAATLARLVSKMSPRSKDHRHLDLDHPSSSVDQSQQNVDAVTLKGGDHATADR